MGRRIEPEEVEHVTDLVPGVEKSCVTVNKKRGQLNVFYCGEAEEKELRNELRKRLPFYMVPQKVRKLEKLPLTKNGKIDRAMLRDMTETGS